MNRYRPAARRRPNPRASLAAFLSFLFPGLGQAYNGEVLLAWLLAVPMLLVVLGGIAAVVLARSDVLSLLLDARFLIGLIVLDLVLLGWRLVAIAQAHGRHEPANARRWTTYVTAALVLVTMVMHVVPAWYAVKAIDTLGAVAREGSGINHGPLAVGGDASPLPEPSHQPEVAHGERVNVLLVGLDSARGPGSELTDTMLVVSLDPDTGESAMISIPRDLYGAPMPNGGAYYDKLNSLMVVAAQRPDEFPLGGVGTLKATIGELLGERIHYFAAIDLTGFKQAIDAIGGVDVTVERGVYDALYADPSGQIIGFYVDPGTYHMDGEFALAYVRSRQGEGDSDFTRAERQQQLLTALRAKLTAGNLVLALPGLLDAVKNTISTDIPSARLPALAAAIQNANTAGLERAVIQPPDYVTPASDPVAGYILHPNLPAIQQLADDILADASHPSP